MIRRTRSEIMEYYADDLKKQGLTFPKLGTPEPIAYVFDEDTNTVFNETVEVIKNFKYSRYKPLVYLKDTKKYASLLAAQHNMGGFMKSILVKRLESSFFAFKNTLSRFQESYEKFIEMYEAGEVYISKKVDVYDLLDSGDDDKLAYLAIIRQVRDNDTALFEKIKKLPKKAKTGRNSILVSDEATVSFIRKGYLKTFFKTEADETKQISFMDAIEYIKCEPDEEKVSVGKNYFGHYDSNNEAFDYSLVEEEVITNARPAVAGNDQKMIRYLRALLTTIKTFTDEQEEKLKRMIEVWENGDVPANDTKAILKEIKNIEDGVEAYYKIEGMLDDKYFEGRKRMENKVDGEKKEVILSCYLKGAAD